MAHTQPFNKTDAKPTQLQTLEPRVLFAGADSLPGLTAYWKLDEGQGNKANDHTGTNADAYLWGNTGQAWAGGLSGSSVQSNQARGLIGEPIALQFKGDMSLSAWVYVYQHQDAWVIAKTSDAPRAGWGLGVNADGEAKFQISGNSSYEIQITGGSVPTGQWVHLAGTYQKGAALRLFVNGTQVAAKTSGVPGSQHNPDTGVTLGNRADGKRALNGKIDEAAAFGRTLSPGEVDGLANGGTGGGNTGGGGGNTGGGNTGGGGTGGGVDNNPGSSGNAINFNQITPKSYDPANQDGRPRGPSAQYVVDSGRELVIAGNAWKRADYNYNVTADTFLEFDFRGVGQPEIGGIGLDTDATFGGGTFYQVWGDEYNAQGFRQESRYNGNGQWRTYRINVGEHWTGNAKTIVFVGDDDASAAGQVRFRNVKLAEAPTDNNDGNDTGGGGSGGGGTDTGGGGGTDTGGGGGGGDTGGGNQLPNVLTTNFGIDVDSNWDSNGRGGGGVITADLNNDGKLDFLFSQSNTIAAYRDNGSLLWRRTGVSLSATGQTEYQGGAGLHGPSIQAGDVDRDGVTEVLYMKTNGKLVVLNGANGSTERELNLPAPSSLGGLNSVTNRWEHVVIADFDGDGSDDLLVSSSRDVQPGGGQYLRGSELAAFRYQDVRDRQTFSAPMWQYSGFVSQSHGAARVADLDGDNKDEVIGGQILDHTGRKTADSGIANTNFPHIDSVAIGNIRTDRAGLEVVLVEEGDDKDVILMGKWGKIWEKNPRTNDGDGDKVQIGDFDTSRPGLEIFLRGADANHMQVLDANGNVISQYWFDSTKSGPNNAFSWTNNGVESISRIEWAGTSKEYLAVKERGMRGKAGVFDPMTGKFVAVFNGQYDRIFTADVRGDWREELLAVNGRNVTIFEPAGNNPNPGHSDLWNDRNYNRLNMTYNYYSA